MEKYNAKIRSILPSLERNDMLKLIAFFTMLIDHIGYQLFPGVMMYRIIGRIAFPIFAYLVAIGYRKTSNLNKYYIRLFIFSLISQVPYMYFSPGRLNIMPTLALGLVAIHLYERDMKLFSFFLVVLAQVLHFQYGGYGLLMILLFHIYYEYPEKILISNLLLNLVYFSMHGGIIQYYSVFSLFFILADIKIRVKMNKYVGYWFYPVHIAILVLIRELVL